MKFCLGLRHSSFAACLFYTAAAVVVVVVVNVFRTIQHLVYVPEIVSTQHIVETTTPSHDSRVPPFPYPQQQRPPRRSCWAVVVGTPFSSLLFCLFVIRVFCLAYFLC